MSEEEGLEEEALKRIVELGFEFLYETKAYKGAIKLFSLARKNALQDREIVLGLGIAHYELGHSDQAKEWFREVIDETNLDKGADCDIITSAYYHLACIARDEHDFSAALEYAQSAQTFIWGMKESAIEDDVKALIDQINQILGRGGAPFSPDDGP